MKVLPDTHAFLWSISGDDRFSKTAEETFLNPDIELLFSAASFWEICIKMSLGKLSLRRGWLNTIQKEMKITSRLLENVAKRILDALFHRFPSIDKARVTVSKMNPPMGGEIEKVAVNLKRKNKKNVI